jgi:hypothetical protein
VAPTSDFESNSTARRFVCHSTSITSPGADKSPSPRRVRSRLVVMRLTLKRKCTTTKDEQPRKQPRHAQGTTVVPPSIPGPPPLPQVLRSPPISGKTRMVVPPAKKPTRDPTYYLDTLTFQVRHVPQ